MPSGKHLKYSVQNDTSSACNFAASIFFLPSTLSYWYISSFIRHLLSDLDEGLCLYWVGVGRLEGEEKKIGHYQQTGHTGVVRCSLWIQIIFYSLLTSRISPLMFPGTKKRINSRMLWGNEYSASGGPISLRWKKKSYLKNYKDVYKMCRSWHWKHCKQFIFLD